MSKFLDRFKNVSNKVGEEINKISEIEQKEKQQILNNKRLKNRESEMFNPDFFDGMDNYGNFNDPFNDNFNYYDNFNDNYGIGIQPAQKPESFHHFILENTYQDLEKSIRGYKDVYNKETRDWEVKRKESHCFTDEEAEEILRTAQSLLATDIKLGFINKEVFGIRMMMIYKRLKQLFREIAEYRYGRYSHDKDGKYIPGGYAKEQGMKLQNLKIFLELTERIVANYSRSIQGTENKLTHQSVSAQESLQSSERLMDRNRRYS